MPSVLPPGPVPVSREELVADQLQRQLEYVRLVEFKLLSLEENMLRVLSEQTRLLDELRGAMQDHCSVGDVCPHTWR